MLHSVDVCVEIIVIYSSLCGWYASAASVSLLHQV